jgi:hypothetical protein
MSAALLAPGEFREVPVPARHGWTATGVAVEAGARYAFTARGTWRDWRTSSGPAGYPSNNWALRRAERWRRVPDGDWFALVAQIGGRKDCRFVIGDAVELAAPCDGALTCAANDVPLADVNNSGSVLVRIQRLG